MADRVFDFGLVKTRSLSSSDESGSSTADVAMGESIADHDLEKTTSKVSQFSRKSKPQLTKVTTAKDWSGPDDPGNPQNWSGKKKIFHTLVPALQCFTVYVYPLHIDLASVHEPMTNLVQHIWVFRIHSQRPISPRTLRCITRSGNITTLTLRPRPGVWTDDRCTHQ